MLQPDASTAGVGPAGPAPNDAITQDPGVTPLGRPNGARRRRYGRQRGAVPIGEWFVSRLGPANGEPFAALDDPHDEHLPARPAPDTPVERLRFVAIDCETTGQSPHRLVELGAVAFTIAGHVASLETLVHSDDRINPYARRLHGITSATLAGAPPADIVLERFRRFAAGAVLVEHSADAFDTRLLARTLGEPLDADNLDTSRLAARLWGLKDTIGLERLCSELGVTHRRPHHALADAEATMLCFIALVERGREQFGWSTLGGLLADGQPPPPRIGPPVRTRRTQVTATAAPATGGDDEKAPVDPAQRRRRRRGGRRRRRAPGTAEGPDNNVSLPPPNA
jgi:DNA polymerase III epsilon subunit-like protein